MAGHADRPGLGSLCIAEIPKKSSRRSKWGLGMWEHPKQVLEHYKGGKLPEMQYLGNTLESKFKLPAAFHEEFSTLFRQNCEY